MSWWSKKAKKHVGKALGLTAGAIGGFLTGGAGWAVLGCLSGYFAGDSSDTAYAASKLSEKQADEAKRQAEEQKKNTLAAAEAESINADRAALKQKKKYGRASTVLGGTVNADGAAKRLLGE